MLAYENMQRALIIDYLLYFHCLYFMWKLGCKQVNWDKNAFLPAPFEPQEKKKQSPDETECNQSLW